MSEAQSASHVFMIRPVRFAGNLETAASNRFQRLDGATGGEAIQAMAQREFAALVAALEGAGVAVTVFDDTIEPHTPDSIFPNNWVSLHADGTVVLYPMLAPNRRLERRVDIIEALDLVHGFRVARTVDLTHREREGKFLEGTGSLVLDRARRVAYACLSPRTDLDVLGEFAQQLDYDVVAFEAHDARGAPIYHTNVLMCVGERFAAVCRESIEPVRRAGVLAMLGVGGRPVVELQHAQMDAFAGNMLELATHAGGKVVAMSDSALAALDAAQRATIERAAGPIVAVPIPTIERLGGGSVRCMLAEVHLPRRM